MTTNNDTRTIIIDAAHALELAGNAQEAVGKCTGAQYDMTPLERATMLGTLQRGAHAIQEAQRHPDVFSAPDDPAGAILLTAMEETAGDIGTLVDGPVPNSLEVKFDEKDYLGWASAAWPYLREKFSLLKERVAFPDGPEQPTPIVNGARVAILGDWGTNLYGAPFCADAIRNDQFKPDVVIHLGDVYYTGTAKQIRERFLDPWPWIAGATSRACNSNHEMLSGGGPFLELTLSEFDQSSSLWWLQNDSWDLVGLDTAWDDATVGTQQVSWLTGIVRAAKKAGRGVIAFSHHQPWRTMAPEVMEGLVAPLQHLLDDRLLTGWYWGHEHLCATFDRHPTWGFTGACLGHGGYPYFTLDCSPDPATKVHADGSWWCTQPASHQIPAGSVLNGPNEFVTGHENDYGPNGYATLDLDVSQCTEVILNARGMELARRTIVNDRAKGTIKAP